MPPLLPAPPVQGAVILYNLYTGFLNIFLKGSRSSARIGLESSLRCVEHWMYHFRVLHGNHDVPNSRQPGTPCDDGKDTRAHSFTYDKGLEARQFQI